MQMQHVQWSRKTKATSWLLASIERQQHCFLLAATQLTQCGTADIEKVVTFDDTLAGVAEAVPVWRIPDGVEGLVDRLALPQPQIEFHFLGLFKFKIDRVSWWCGVAYAAIYRALETARNHQPLPSSLVPYPHKNQADQSPKHENRL